MARTGRPIAQPDADNVVATLRRVRGWSQAQTAEALGVSRSTVSELERGIYAPKGPVLRLCQLLMADAAADSGE